MTKKSTLVVAADAYSFSDRAKSADDYVIPIGEETVFARHLGEMGSTPHPIDGLTAPQPAAPSLRVHRVAGPQRAQDLIHPFPDTVRSPPSTRTSRPPAPRGARIRTLCRESSGKTTLLDLAHSATSQSLRWHASDFFSVVHQALPRHRRNLEDTISALTGRAGTVFFDEFHVHDVADSIYLDRALAWWLSHGVRVISTSNYAPGNLLPNPLLHHAAEPLIERIHENIDLMDLDEGIDHRFHSQKRSGGFSNGAWCPAIPHPLHTTSSR